MLFDDTYKLDKALAKIYRWWMDVEPRSNFPANSLQDAFQESNRLACELEYQRNKKRNEYEI